MRWIESGTRERGLEYRPELDGLRGIAILAVVGYHAFPALVPGGFVGVDVFFVLSGFLISSIILRQLRGATFTLGGFYLRRVRRLFPALALVLAVCLLLGWFLLLPEEFENLGRHIGAAAAFVLNFAVRRESGYFDPAAERRCCTCGRWASKSSSTSCGRCCCCFCGVFQEPCLAGVAAIVVVSFALAVAYARTDPRGGFFLPVTRFWELGLGSLLAVLDGPTAVARLRPRLPDRWRAKLSMLGVALICAAAFLFDSRMASRVGPRCCPRRARSVSRRSAPEPAGGSESLAGGPLVFVGVISYPLYLWHWPLLSFATILGSGSVPAVVRAAAVLVSFILAYLVFRFVEQPIRVRPELRTSGMLAAGLGALGVAGLAVFAANGVHARFGHDVRYLETASRVNRYCPPSFADRGLFNYCKSNSASAPEVVFLGDSRTQAVYEGIVSLVDHGDARHRMLLLARGGCPPMLGVGSDASDAHRGAVMRRGLPSLSISTSCSRML